MKRLGVWVLCATLVGLMGCPASQEPSVLVTPEPGGGGGDAGGDGGDSEPVVCEGRCARHEAVVGGACVPCGPGFVLDDFACISPVDVACEDTCLGPMGRSCSDVYAGDLEFEPQIQVRAVDLDDDVMVLTMYDEDAERWWVEAFEWVDGAWASSQVFELTPELVAEEGSPRGIVRLRDGLLIMPVFGSDLSGVNTGLEWVFMLARRTGTGWSEVEVIDGFDSPSGFSAPEALAEGGVFIASDQIRAHVEGEPGNETFTPTAGAVQVFEETAQGWARTQTLFSPDPVEDEQFGSALEIGGGQIFAGGDDAVIVYEKSGGVWTQVQRLATGATSIDIDGDTLIVGDATGVINGDGGDDGVARIYERQGGQWVERAVLESVASTSSLGALFGSHVYVDGDRAGVIGFTPNELGVTASPGPAFGGTTGGLFSYTNVGGQWTFEAVLPGLHKFVGDITPIGFSDTFAVTLHERDDVKVVRTFAF